MKTFSDLLYNAVSQKRTPVLVGLDPRWKQIPSIFTQGKVEQELQERADVYEEFCKKIIDIAAPLVPAVKPQSAFFEQCGVPGIACLVRIIRYATDKGLLVILDGKRNDIGSTATAYADGLLGAHGRSPGGADALTVSPYLGDDSLTPFVETARKRQSGIFILVKTSNPGGALFQDLIADGKPIYRHVAEYVEQLAVKNRDINTISPYSIIGAVVGATWPEQLTELRGVLKHSWILVPGYGSQGGGAKDVAGAFDDKGFGALVNNSRGIIFAYQTPKYADKFGESHWEEAVDAAIRDMIADLADNTTAGNL